MAGVEVAVDTEVLAGEMEVKRCGGDGGGGSRRAGGRGRWR